MASPSLPCQLANGAYRLERSVGRGGMAEVFEATVDLTRFDFPLLLARRNMTRAASREQLAEAGPPPEPWGPGRLREFRSSCDLRALPYPRGERVAVKILDSTTPQVVERFIGEWLGLMGCSHPHVMEVYSGGYEPAIDRHYYAMQLLPGLLTEAEIVDLSPLEQLEIARQAALGLQALHERGLVHRDVKPGNLMVQRAPAGGHRVRVGDLGVAKDMDRALSLTMSRQALGTPYFMAPELVVDSRQAAPTSDVYMLGATLYTYLAGQAPYEGEGVYGLLCKLQQHAPPTPIQMLRPEVPLAAARLVAHLMGRQPADRPGSMVAAIEAIDAAMQAIEATPTAAPSGPAASPGPGRLTRAGARLLVVEPDPDRRELLTKLLHQVDYEVAAASNGAEALLHVGRGGLQVVLLSDALADIPLGRMLEIITDAVPGLPVILLSDDRERPPGAAATLERDAPLAQLVRTLEALVD